MRSWNLLSMDSCANRASRHLLTLSALGVAALSMVACVETDGDDNSTLERGDRATAGLIGQGEGSLYWLKEDPYWNSLGGATFEICRTHDTAGVELTAPLDCYTIEDNGAHDADARDGVLLVEGLWLGTWSITETVAPAGYVADPHDTQSVTLTELDPDGEAAMEFMNELAGSLRWNKEDEHWQLLGGATFEACRTHAWNYDTSSMDLLTTPECIEITDNGPNDSDPRAGLFVLEGVRLGGWLIRETAAPAGYTPTSAVHTVELTPSAPHDTENEAFMNAPAGSLYWLKEDEHWNGLPGATFEVCLTHEFGWDAAMNEVYTELPVPDCWSITDNDSLDEDPRDGVLKVSGIPLGYYTITETAAPAGYALDPHPQTVILSLSDPDGQPAHEFLNLPLGGLSFVKVDEQGAPLGGATFEICRIEAFGFDMAMLPIFIPLPAPYDCFSVTDNGAGDDDPAAGAIAVSGLELGRYSVTETAAPTGYILDPNSQIVELSADVKNGSAANPFVNLPDSPPKTPGACTHGFFKNHSGQWDDAADMLVINAGFDINTDLHTFFNLTPAQTGLPADLTMLGALQLGGGDAVNVVRQGVTALLNVASGYAYPYTPTVTLYDDIRNALINKTYSLGDTLDRANNLEECRLPGNVGHTPKELKKPETPASNGNGMLRRNNNRR